MSVVRAAGCVVVLFFGAGCGILEEDKSVGEEEWVHGPVDLLFVMDGSSSMSDEAGTLLREAAGFFETLGDVQVAITTPSMVATDGWFNDAEGGETGLFIGTNPVVTGKGAAASHHFSETVACWGSCWDSYEMESNVSYAGTIGDCPFPDSNGDGGVDAQDRVTTQYLDCMCAGAEYPEGEDWDAVELCRSGNELHLESTLMALCRSAEEPPEICYHVGSPFEGSWIGSNQGWLRPDSTIMVVVVSDEGDQSETAVGGLQSGGDDDPQVYVDAFAEFGRPIVFSAIGPDLICESANDCYFQCNSGGASATGVRRLKKLAQKTGGVYRPISSEDCGIADPKGHYEALAELISER